MTFEVTQVKVKTGVIFHVKPYFSHCFKDHLAFKSNPVCMCVCVCVHAQSH